MQRKVMLILTGSLFLLTACSAVQVRTEFNPVGKLATAKPSKQTVDSADKVAVYIKSSPEGFTLKENELEVEEGYAHEILGEIKAFQKKLAGNFQGAKTKTIAALQQTAFEQGANAVIYCVLNISDNPQGGEIETGWKLGYGSGWAVVVENKYLE